MCISCLLHGCFARMLCVVPLTCCVLPGRQAQRAAVVRQQSEKALREFKQRVTDRLEDKLDSAEENRQNQIKAIKVKLQEHVSCTISLLFSCSCAGVVWICVKSVPLWHFTSTLFFLGQWH